MGLIVLSKVLRYKALIIAVILISTLAFFQSDQSLVDTQVNNDKGVNEKIQGANIQAPSIPQTPTLPDTPNLPGDNNIENNNTNSSSSKISISIKTIIRNNSAGEVLEEMTTIEEIQREIINGSISLKFTNFGGEQNIKEKTESEDGKTSVKFRVKSSQDSESKIEIEQKIEKKIETDN